MPTTWYVNLDADPRNHRGPEIPVKVTRSVVTSYDAHRSVTWTCTPAGTNLNTVVADASWKAGTAPNTQVSTVSEQAQTREFHNRLKLPPYGDESYTITAQRSDKTGVSLTEQFDIRRRVYYVTNWMNDEGKRLLAIVEPIIARIFGEVGVELKKVGSASIPDRAGITDVQPLVQNRPALPQAKIGLMMRLALINMAYKELPQTVTLPVVDGHGAGVAGADTVEDDNGVWQLTVHLPPEPALAAHRRMRLGAEPEVKVGLNQYYRFSNNVRATWFDNEQSFPCDVVRVDDRTVRIRIRDGVRPNNANLTQLAAAYRLAVANGNFPSTHFEGTPPTGPELALEVTVVGLRPLGGFSSGPNICLTQDMSQYYPQGTRQQKGQALARVFAHEIAHSIAMVIQHHNYNGAQNTHPNWYDDQHGGHGTHCHLNAGLVNNTPIAAGDFYYPDNPNCVQVYTPNNANICIMFHQRTAHLDTLEFCADCQEFMRAQDLSRANLRTVRSWHRLY
jgi:hypothetical protein